MNDYLKNRQAEEDLTCVEETNVASTSIDIKQNEEITVASVMSTLPAEDVANAVLAACTTAPMANISKQLFAGCEKKQSVRRQSILEIEETKKIIEKSINDTWAEVDCPGEQDGVCNTPPKTLTPFEYYSEDENEFNSDSENDEEIDNVDKEDTVVDYNVQASLILSSPSKKESEELENEINPLLVCTPERSAVEKTEGVPASESKTPSKGGSTRKSKCSFICIR
jgi:hypothetical protein